MKLKILTAPLVIVTIIYLLIWLVYPLYTNGTDGIKEKQAEMAKESDSLEKIKAKNILIEKLAGEVEANKNSKNILYQYIPDAIREEEIIDNVNYLSSNEGLSIRHLSVLPVKNNEGDFSGAATQTSGSFANSVAANASGTAASGQLDLASSVMAIEPPKPKDIPVEFMARGDYAKMRTILGKVFALERFNKIESLEIRYVEGKDRNPADLQMDMELSFNFMKKFNREVSMEDPVFALTQADMETSSSITAKKNVDVLPLTIDHAGRSNPFAL